LEGELAAAVLDLSNNPEDDSEALEIFFCENI